MTRLHYLAARNNGKRKFRLLPEAVKRILDAQTVIEETCVDGRRTLPVGRGFTPEGHHFGEARIFHIAVGKRPPGIPDDIHESYK